MRKLLFLIISIVLTQVFLICQEEIIEPADSMIKAVQFDLEKYEKEAEAIAPGNKSSVNRVMRMIPIVESRLNSSKNQTHASWVQSKNRLNTLKEKLNLLAKGEKLEDKKQAEETSQDDHEIAQQFQKDYNTLYSELKTLKGPDFANAETVAKYQTKLGELKALTERFKDPSLPYVDACKKNHESLSTWFKANVEKFKPVEGQNKKEENTPPAETAAELDYANKRALMFFDKDYDRFAPSFQNVEPSKVSQLTSNIETLENRYSKITMQKHPLVLDARKKLDALKAKLNDPSLEEAVAKQKAEEEKQSKMKSLSYPQRFALESGENRVKEVLKSLDKLKEQTDFTNKPREGLGLTQTLDKILADMKEAGLPEDLEQANTLKKKVADARTAVLEEEKRHIQMFEQKDKVANISNYPNYEKDLETLRNLYLKYNENKIFGQGNESLAKDLMSSYQQDQKTYETLFATYNPFMEMNKANYNKFYKQKEDLSRNFRVAREAMEKFSKQQKEFLDGAAIEIEKFMKETDEMLTEAVTTKKPSWITGGVAQKLGFASAKLKTYSEILGPTDQNVKILQSKHDALSAKVDKARVDMREEILAAQLVPPDAYAGGDKEDLKKLAQAEWNKTHPDKPILKSGIAMQNWDRRTEWRWSSGTRYKVDVSYIQVYIIVKTDDRIATKYIVDVNKNHMKGDQVSYSAPKNLNSNAVFKTEMLLSNVK